MNKSEQLIACLEGEIAKRDARILELESQYQRDVFGLNNEGDPIGGDPAGGYANDNARLRTELAAIKAQEPVEYQLRALIRDVTNISEAGYYMPQSWHDQVIALSLSGKLDAPVSEAKAQGVVMPRDIEKSFLEWASAQLQAPTQLASYMAGADEVARLNASPVQQVSVQDGWRELLRDIEQFFEGAGVSPGPDIELRMAAMLAAAPAAPAADAGLIEALERTAQLAEMQLEIIAARAPGNYLDKTPIVRAFKRYQQIAKDALAAHRAKGVL